MSTPPVMVAGLQMDLAWEDPQENFRRAEEMVKRAASAQARFLVLPEMFATGFSMDAAKVSAFAEETRAFLAGLARTHGVSVLGGYAEPAEPRPANACSIFDPSGEETLHFRKLHPFSLAGEDESYLAGDSVETVEVEGIRVTPLICYDLRFPEPFRPAAQDTDLYCVVANWPSMRREAWSALLKARAIENQAYVLGVNRVGEGDGKPHTGDSVLFDPMGVEVAAATPGEPGLVLAEVDPGRVADVRRRLSFLDDRRPGLYHKLESDRHG
ncbi:nitrilase-related carbon-nitrogen hydrolase [Gemmatimonadota bacterium]